MPSRRTRLPALLAIGLVAAACNAGAMPVPSTVGPATTPSSSAMPSSAPTPSSAPVIGSPSPKPSVPAQANTPWGRIWEGVPSGFPKAAGAEPTEVGGTEPASATLDVPASAGTATDVMSFYRSALGAAGYSVSVDGPLENGGYTVSATGQAGCAAQVSVAPLGSSITVTVLYGAACPFD